MNLSRVLRSVVVAWLLPAAIGVLALMLLVYGGPASIPGLGQRPSSGLRDLDDLSQLQTMFNQDVGRPRLLLLMSPT